jgi:hypothetical protein
MNQADAPAHGCTSYVLSIIVAAFLIPETSAFHAHTIHTVHTRLCELACNASSDQQSSTIETSKQSQARKQQQQQKPALSPLEQRLPARVRQLNDWSDAPAAAVVIQKPTAVVAARQQAHSTTQQPKQAAAQQPRAVRMSRVELQAILTRLQSGTDHTIIHSAHHSYRILLTRGICYCCYLFVQRLRMQSLPSSCNL